MYPGRPSVRPSTSMTRDAISLFIGGISMKLVTNIHHVTGHCWKPFQGQRSKVKIMSSVLNLWRWRHILRRCGVEGQWFTGNLRQARYVMSGVRLSVCLSVCLFVCLLATIRGIYTDLHENFITDVSAHKEELLKFWKSSASGSGFRNFFEGFFQHCESGHFSTIWLISPEGVIGFSWKFYHRCIPGQGSRR